MAKIKDKKEILMICPHCLLDTDKDILTIELDINKHPDNQLKKMVETIYIDGVKDYKKTVQWTYYPTSEVNEIDFKIQDKNDDIKIHKKIKHFLDGRQPEVTIISGEE